MNEAEQAIGNYAETTCCLCWKPITASYVREGGIVQRLALGAVAHRACWNERYYEPKPQPAQEVQAALALEESE